MFRDKGKRSQGRLWEKGKKQNQRYFEKIDIRERYYKRIYREDPKIIYNKSQVLQQVIVKFKGFSPSSSVYGARKWKSNISVQLNLTKRHYLLLKEKINDDDGIEFVYADVNFIFCLRLKNGKFVNSSEELEQLPLNLQLL